MGLSDISSAISSELKDRVKPIEDTLKDSYLEESTDLLDNLGYIDFSKDGSEKRPPVQTIRKGARLFRADFKASLIYEPLPSEVSGDLTEFELDALAHFSSLEDDVFPLSSYGGAIFTDPILRRVLTYRLNILGLVSDKAQPSTEGMKDALANLMAYLDIGTEEDVLLLLDDFHRLIHTAASRDWGKGKGFRNMVVLDYDGHKRFKNNVKCMEDSLSLMPQDDREFYAKRLIGNSSPIQQKGHLNRVVNHSFNKFMARLIQIKLWLDGFYGHEIDGDMRVRSVEAILDLHELVAQYELPENEAKRVLPQCFLYRVDFPRSSQKYWLVNYKHLLIDGIACIEEFAKGFTSSTHAVSAQMHKMLDEVDDERKKDQLLQEVKREVMAQYTSSDRRKKKVRKSKGFMRFVISFFKKVKERVVSAFEAVKNAVISFFKKVKNAAAYLIREIREAIGKVKMALIFFFSKRLITTGAYSTDFDVDFDVVSSFRDTEQSPATHLDRVKRMVSSMGQVFEVMQVVIPIIIKVSQGPVGWVKLGIELVRILLQQKIDLRMRPAFDLIKI